MNIINKCKDNVTLFSNNSKVLYGSSFMNTRPGLCNFPGSLSDNKTPPFCPTVDFSAPYGRKGVKIQISQPQVLSDQESIRRSEWCLLQTNPRRSEEGHAPPSTAMSQPLPAFSCLSRLPEGKEITPIAVMEIHTIPSLSDLGTLHRAA